jgi:nicotinamide mononucleotide (NMN) deamidase PncC
MFETLQSRMETSEIKTAETTSGGYFKVSLVTISAQSDVFRKGLPVAQVGTLHKKLIFGKNLK